MLPQREVLNKLARDDYQVIDPKDRIFFRDIYDHLVRLHDLNESLRDLVGGVLDTYLSVINNRMNEVMKTLTIITTLFMPLTFVTGFFGMNFFEPLGLTERLDNQPSFLSYAGNYCPAAYWHVHLDAPPHLGLRRNSIPQRLTQNRRSVIIHSTNERRMLICPMLGRRQL